MLHVAAVVCVIQARIKLTNDSPILENLTIDVLNPSNKDSVAISNGEISGNTLNIIANYNKCDNENTMKGYSTSNVINSQRGHMCPKPDILLQHLNGHICEGELQTHSTDGEGENFHRDLSEALSELDNLSLEPNYSYCNEKPTDKQTTSIFNHENSKDIHDFITANYRSSNKSFKTIDNSFESEIRVLINDDQVIKTLKNASSTNDYSTSNNDSPNYMRKCENIYSTDKGCKLAREPSPRTSMSEEVYQDKQSVIVNNEYSTFTHLYKGKNFHL